MTNRTAAELSRYIEVCLASRIFGSTVMGLTLSIEEWTTLQHASRERAETGSEAVEAKPSITTPTPTPTTPHSAGSYKQVDVEVPYVTRLLKELKD